MRISEDTISGLGPIISGNGAQSEYRSGPELVAFFNQFGSDDEYGQGFPSRWSYVEDKLRQFNGHPEMENIVLAAIDARRFLRSEYSCEAAVEHLNLYLEFDGFQIVSVGNKHRVTRLAESDVEIEHPFGGSITITHVFIVEQLAKCNRKLAEGDFDGAITNARSLVEAVLTDIERKHDTNPPDYDGKLPQLYRRVQKLLRLSPGQEDLGDNLRQILSGLTSIVNGLASLRNSMSDAHVRSYRPVEHHARLAVNSAKTLCHFLFDTQAHQLSLEEDSDSR